MDLSICHRWCHVNKKKLPNIKCFTYVFPCDFAKKNNEAGMLYIMKIFSNIF